MLLDCGATTIFVSRRWVNANKLETTKFSDKNIRVKLGDNQFVEAELEVLPLEIMVTGLSGRTNVLLSSTPYPKNSTASSEFPSLRTCSHKSTGEVGELKERKRKLCAGSGQGRPVDRSRKADRLLPLGFGDLSRRKAFRRKYPIPVEAPRWKRITARKRSGWQGFSREGRCGAVGVWTAREARDSSSTKGEGEGEDEDERAAYEGECERRVSEDRPAGAAAASGSTAITVGTYPSPRQPGRSVGAADQTNARNDESSGRAVKTRNGGDAWKVGE
ncbi:hypothetical protein PC119_g15960 [Phytophthora cactorum]|nr:hypothetical protein PC119_g15960 [Phytophthora cactorum]KAG3141186.1 hypothetical protein C6341_g19835 [Phytophthora cactorum]